jgi:hypothetical protein
MKNRSILFQGDIELMRGDAASIQIVYNKLTSPNVSRAYTELLQAVFEIEFIIPSQLRIANATTKFPRNNMRNANGNEP